MRGAPWPSNTDSRDSSGQKPRLQSGPVGKIPTFSPKSGARGRAVAVVFCASVIGVTNKTATAARSFFAIVRDYIFGRT